MGSKGRNFATVVNKFLFQLLMSAVVHLGPNTKDFYFLCIGFLLVADRLIGTALERRFH